MKVDFPSLWGRKAGFSAVLGLILLGLIPSALAQEPAEDTDRARIEAVRLQVRQIDDFLRGRLDPSVDARSLFAIDLAGDFGEEEQERFQNLVRAAAAPSPRRAQSRRSQDPLEATLNDLATRFQRFLALPREARSQLLAEHHARAASFQEQAEAEERARVRLLEIATRADQLHAFLQGSLAPAVDPASLVVVNLIDDGMLRQERAEALLDGESASSFESSGPLPDESATLEDIRSRIRLEEQRFDRMRLDYSLRPRVDRQALLVEHQARQQALQEPEEREDPVVDLDEAAREREAAEVEANRARSESARVIADERVRLLDLKEELGAFESQLVGRDQALAAETQDRGDWQTRLSTLQESTGEHGPTEPEADALHRRLEEPLFQAGAHFNELIHQRTSAEEAPTPGTLVDDPPDDLIELHSELTSVARELTEREQELYEAEVEGARDRLTTLRTVRHYALEFASPSLRGETTGFGATGAKYAGAEAQSVTDEVWFYARSGPARALSILEQARRYPMPFLWKLALLLAIAVGWLFLRRPDKRRTQAATPSLDLSTTVPPPSSPLDSTVIILERVRGPLAMLVAAGLAYWVVRSDSFPEVDVIWQVAAWWLGGLVAVGAVLSFFDLAFRRKPESLRALRTHAAKLIGRTAVLVGILLSLSASVVGRGTIHSWLSAVLWIPVVSVLLYLLHRFRPYVFDRLEQIGEVPTPIRWTVGRRKGLMSYPAALVAGVYILGRDLLNWGVRFMSRYELTRVVLGALLRREVARLAESQASQTIYTPAKDEVTALFSPEIESKVRLPELFKDHVQQIRTTISAPGVSLSAVIGERGFGKTTLLKQLDESYESGGIYVQCPPGGFVDLLSALADALDLPDGRRDTVLKGLQEKLPEVVIVDDLHRLVRTTIGGLQDLDRFIDLARRVGNDVSWVASIGAPAWHFIKRARGDRVFFDYVADIDPWQEPDLRRLIEIRIEQADLDVSFDALNLPRQLGDVDDQRTVEDGYFRVLAGYTSGNPAVALHAFSESLTEDPGGNHYVQLFREQPLGQLEDVNPGMRLIFRALMQLETASKSDLAESTAMPIPDVEDALRFAVARGFVEPDEERVAISLSWYTAIRTLLTRQHLLALK